MITEIKLFKSLDMLESQGETSVLFASGSYDGFCRIYDILGSGEPLFQIEGFYKVQNIVWD